MAEPEAVALDDVTPSGGETDGFILPCFGAAGGTTGLGVKASSEAVALDDGTASGGEADGVILLCFGVPGRTTGLGAKASYGLCRMLICRMPSVQESSKLVV